MINYTLFRKTIVDVMKEFLIAHSKETFQEWDVLFCFLRSPKVQIESHKAHTKRLVQLFERKRFYKVAFEKCRKENISMKESMERMSSTISQITEENRLSNEQLFSYKAIEEDDSELRHEIEAIRREKERQEEINNELQSIVDRVQDENRTYLDRLESLQSVSDQIHSKLELSESLLNECRKEKDIILIDKESLNEKFNTLHSENLSLKTQYQLCDDKYRQLMEETTSLRSLFQELEIEKSRDSKRISDMENLCSVLTSEKEQKDTTIADLQLKMNSSESDWLEQEKHLQCDISQLKEELQMARDRDSKGKLYIEKVIARLASAGIVPHSLSTELTDEKAEAYGWEEVGTKIKSAVSQLLKEKEEIFSRLNRTETQLKNLEMESRQSVTTFHGQLESLSKKLDEKEAELVECRGRMVIQEDSHKIALGNQGAQLAQCKKEMEVLRADIVTRDAMVINLEQKLNEKDMIANETYNRLETEYQSKIHELSGKRCEDKTSLNEAIVQVFDAGCVIESASETDTLQVPAPYSARDVDTVLSLNELAQKIIDDYVHEALERFP